MTPIEASVAGIELTAANVLPVALAYGFGSAWIPILNAEVFVAALVAVMPHAWWWPVIVLAFGQTLGKCAMFLAARRGATWLTSRERPRKERAAAGPWRTRVAVWSRMMLELLDRRVQGFLVVLLAASVGIPPLAIVAVVAGTRRLPLPVFFAACLLGRVARFLVLAWPIAHALS
ncbi:MAG: VTT domain-containing protein [Actinobacteria bacterium]|nr:VTT domain-containing protein [Actinomycetota bacterium]